LPYGLSVIILIDAIGREGRRAKRKRAMQIRTARFSLYPDWVDE
jgi:hypothetical protein